MFNSWTIRAVCVRNCLILRLLDECLSEQEHAGEAAARNHHARVCRPMTNSSRKQCPIPLKYEQLERSTCPCRDTSATRALKAQHETFSSTEVLNDKVAIHGECLRSRRSRIHRAAAVTAAAVEFDSTATRTGTLCWTARTCTPDWFNNLTLGQQ